MQEKKKKMTSMQSLCAFSYPRAYNSLLLLISTLGLSVKGTFVDYRLPPPHLGNVGTRHDESVSALVIGHGMPCPYHSIVSFENRSLIRTLELRSKVLLLGSKNKSKFILYFSRLFVPLHASSGVHGRYWSC